MSAILSAEKITRSFGGLLALSDVSLEVGEGELVGLIGPNGAGKTTFFNVLTGLTRPDAGQVRLCGQDITGLRPDRIAALGLARTFQNIRLFGNMSLLDNVLVAGQVHARCGLMAGLVGLPSGRREERTARTRAIELLSLVGLADHALAPAGSLSYGDRRRLEIARALALGPKVLLLDEPAAGMNPAEKQGLAEFILGIKKAFGLAVLLIEHHVPLVMGICDRVAVLDFGQLLAVGRPEDIRKDRAVISAYLGGTA